MSILCYAECAWCNVHDYFIIVCFFFLKVDHGHQKSGVFVANKRAKSKRFWYVRARSHIDGVHDIDFRIFFISPYEQRWHRLHLYAFVDTYIHNNGAIRGYWDASVNDLFIRYPENIPCPRILYVNWYRFGTVYLHFCPECWFFVFLCWVCVFLFF